MINDKKFILSLITSVTDRVYVSDIIKKCIEHKIGYHIAIALLEELRTDGSIELCRSRGDVTFRSYNEDAYVLGSNKAIPIPIKAVDLFDAQW